MGTIERKGKVTALGTQVGRDSATMFIEIDKFKIDFPEGSIVTVKVDTNK